MAGPDAAKYLQGVITANIIRLQKADYGTAVPSGFYSAFLSAQGRVLHDVFVYRDTLGAAGGAAGGDDSAFLIEVDAEEAATLTKHIKRYKLRAKFDVRLLDTGELAVWHAWGLPEGSSGTGDGVVALDDTRAPGLGRRYVARPASQSSTTGPVLGADVDVDAADEAAYRVHRYLLGVAEGQREILRNQALPLESNMDLMGAIDFHKGCYVGQELTIRTRHRGVVRKRILPCVVYGGEDETAVPAEMSLSYQDGPAADIPSETSIGRVGKRGRSAGKWLSGVGSLGLALCRLETMTDLVLPGEAAASAAAATAFDPGSEFVLNTGEEGGSTLRIRAFVPEWLRQGLEADAGR